MLQDVMAMAYDNESLSAVELASEYTDKVAYGKTGSPSGGFVAYPFLLHFVKPAAERLRCRIRYRCK